MHGFGVSAQEAFDMLVTLSQDTNTKLRDVAGQLLDQLPDLPRAEPAAAFTTRSQPCGTGYATIDRRD
ncbi:hypothetical protein A4G29_13100 [Mycobacterium kansasii]|nr:hypothetical protein A4G29_13100 [Mycobacterium kansasii]